ncbi:sensor histidine kinase [Amycolatopsis sp. NPDC059021]|uniref:sensor histidine kinase n=1 Tax=Amycolatopsis sp. NPDC059021 TaxID=3346704 RepID=UPI00366D34A5
MHEGQSCERRMIWPALAVGVCVAATAWGEHVSGIDPRWLVLDLVLGLGGCAMVPLLNRGPVAVTLVLVVLAAVSPTATPPYSVGLLHTARCRRNALAIGVALAGVAAHALRGVWRPMAGLSYVWWLVLVVLGHAAFVGWGALAAARHALIASLRERARRAEAEQGRRVAEARAAERTRIAREMHDVLAHRLSLLATYAGAMEFRPDSSPERLSDAAGVVRATAHQALNELRDVIVLLRDEDTAADGAERPVPVLADLPELVEESRSAGTPVEVQDAVAEPAALPGTTGRTAYRVVQEALTNARKHAPGRPVRIALDGSPGTRLVIAVSNPLPGTPAELAIPGAGTGLVGLTERVRLAGGELDHQATPEEFRLSAWLPWPA